MDETKIIPATKSTMESYNTNKLEPQNLETCLFIFQEDGLWEASKKFYKLGAVADRSGWFIKNEHKDEIEAFCLENNMQIIYDYPMPDFKSLELETKLTLFAQQLEINKREINAEAFKKKIEYSSIDDLYLYQKKLENDENGIKLLKLLFKRQDLLKNISKIKNEQQSTFIINNNNQEKNISYNTKSYPTIQFINEQKKNFLLGYVNQI